MEESSTENKQKKLFGKFLIYCLSIAFFIFVFSYLFELQRDELLNTLSSISVSSFLVIFLLIFISTIICQSIFIASLCSHEYNKKNSFLRIALITTQIQFYALAAPPGGLMAIRMFKLSSIGFTPELSIASVLMFRIVSIIIYSFIGIIFLYHSSGVLLELENNETPVVYISILLIALFVLSVLKKNVTAYNKVRSIFYELKKFYFINKAGFIKATIYLCLSTLLGALAYYLMFNEIKLSISFIEVFLLRGFIMMIGSIPFSFMGVGIREVSMVAILPSFGASIEQSLIAVSLILILQIALAIFGLILEVLQFLRKKFNTN
jgi:uncharacterized membrane protein YbhN (UPF0104 family)